MVVCYGISGFGFYPVSKTNWAQIGLLNTKRLCRSPRNQKKPITYFSNLLVGDYDYFPTMVGMMYLIKWNAGKLYGQALFSISDLGKAGKTLSLSDLACAVRKLYARTIKELLCIGECFTRLGEEI